MKTALLIANLILTACVGTMCVLILNNRRSIRAMVNFEEILKKIDAATTAAAERVRALVAKLNPDPSPELQAEADAIIAHLESLAADPAQPVPEAAEPAAV